MADINDFLKRQQVPFAVDAPPFPEGHSRVTLVFLLAIDDVAHSPFVVAKVVAKDAVDKTVWGLQETLRQGLNAGARPLYMAERLVQTVAEAFADLSAGQNMSKAKEIATDFGFAVTVARELRSFETSASEQCEIDLRRMCAKYGVTLDGAEGEDAR